MQITLAYAVSITAAAGVASAAASPTPTQAPLSSKNTDGIYFADVHRSSGGWEASMGFYVKDISANKPGNGFKTDASSMITIRDEGRNANGTVNWDASIPFSVNFSTGGPNYIANFASKFDEGALNTKNRGDTVGEGYLVTKEGATKHMVCIKMDAGSFEEPGPEEGMEGLTADIKFVCYCD